MAAAIYIIGGVAMGYSIGRRGGGGGGVLSAHPHFPLWKEIPNLCGEGVTYSRARLMMREPGGSHEPSFVRAFDSENSSENHRSHKSHKNYRSHRSCRSSRSQGDSEKLRSHLEGYPVNCWNEVLSIQQPMRPFANLVHPTHLARILSEISYHRSCTGKKPKVLPASCHGANCKSVRDVSH